MDEYLKTIATKADKFTTDLIPEKVDGLKWKEKLVFLKLIQGFRNAIAAFEKECEKL